jgi:hypothetical protein
MYHDRSAMLPVEKWVLYPRAVEPSARTRAAFRMVRVLSPMPDQTKSHPDWDDFFAKERLKVVQVGV